MLVAREYVEWLFIDSLLKGRVVATEAAANRERMVVDAFMLRGRSKFLGARIIFAFEL